VVRHRGGGSRRDPAVLPSNLAQIGRALRRSRLSQGMAVPDAARRASISIAELEGLEAGDPQHLPDQVHTVNLLRRYAEALGLPADRYALALLDAWPAGTPAGQSNPSRPGQPPPASGHVDQRPEPTHTAAEPPRSPAWDPAGMPTAATKGQTAEGATGVLPGRPLDPFQGAPDAYPRAAGTTAQIPAGPPGEFTTGFEQSPGPSAGLPGDRPATDQMPSLVADTGPTDVVPPRSGRRSGTSVGAGGTRPRQGGDLTFLRVAVGLVLLLIVIGAAGLAIHHWRPQWLHSLEHNGRGTDATSSTRSRAPTASSTPAGGGSVDRAVTTSSTSASVTVHSGNANIRVSSEGNPAWTEVSEPGHSAPLFAGDLQGGQSEQFALHSSLVVQVGSSAGRAAVVIDNKVVREYSPQLAPYTYTFKAVSG
jgi:transcriptional regulator with XRE-family HTH domain